MPFCCCHYFLVKPNAQVTVQLQRGSVGELPGVKVVEPKHLQMTNKQQVLWSVWSYCCHIVCYIGNVCHIVSHVFCHISSRFWTKQSPEHLHFPSVSLASRLAPGTLEALEVDIFRCKRYMGMKRLVFLDPSPLLIFFLVPSSRKWIYSVQKKHRFQKLTLPASNFAALTFRPVC